MLTIHTSNRLEQLKAQYAELIQTPLSNALKTETVVVQNAGMGRWLSIEMAKTSGISANIEYLFPAEYMWRLLRLVSPDIPEHSQCAPDTLRFHIYNELISQAIIYPELHHYIYKPSATQANTNPENIIDELSTWELSCQMARLLDQYLFYRADWITAWENDTVTNIEQYAESSNPMHWQKRLWNNCVRDKQLLHWLQLQTQFAHNIEHLDTAILEERVSFFSMSALSPGYVDLLAGVAQKTDIHIFIINPCGDVYWGDIQSPKTHAKLDKTEQEYSDIGNPLLASLGKQGRDFIDKLISIQDQNEAEDFNDTDHYNSKQSNTLLSQVQSDIYTLEAPVAMPAFDKNDQSIQLHACHTAMREVEVIYDQILSRLDSDPALLPSDIVVMMPDIEQYAPYIEAVFSNPISNTQQQKLPFSIADRDPQNIFKIVQALNKIFNLPDTRFDVEAVLELLEYEDIRQHFGIDEAEFNYCRELALATNIRWGISAKTRLKDNLPHTEEHTWKYALDRMLLGYALSENNAERDESYHKLLFQSKRLLKLLPYNDIEGTNALILAKFKAFTDTVFSINKWQDKRYPLKTWIEKSIGFIKQICPQGTEQERLFKTLSDIEIKADLAEFSQDLAFPVFQKIVQQSLAEISANEKFLGYGITFCALVPMRSVPFKIVVLMGMNDGEFPRQDTHPSFDLMAKEARRGDRSRRDEDRYLFLESILAARQQLIISYIGQSIKDNTELAPSILVSELLDTLVINSGINASEWINKHPLQAFSSRYFNQQEKTQQPLFSYSSHYLQIKSQDDKPVDTDTPFITEKLPALSDDYKTLSLTDLITFYKNPSREFLTTRFSMKNIYEEQALVIREPFEIEFFDDRKIRSLMLAENTGNCETLSITRAKGLLPYGQIGDAIYAKEKQTIDTFKQKLQELDALSSINMSLTLNEFTLHINLTDISQQGRQLIYVGQPYAGDYIDLWLSHLCLNIHTQQSNKQTTQAVTYFYSPEISFQLNPVEQAKTILFNLLTHYWNGLHEPLTFFPKSGFALYKKVSDYDGKLDLTKMNDKWNGNDWTEGEKESVEHKILHRHINLDKDQQPDAFMQISEEIFGNLASVLTKL